MVSKNIINVRQTIEFCKEIGDLLVVNQPVDPVLEISGIQKALDDGPAILFDNITGYPGVRSVGNLFSRKERTAAMFGVSEPNRLKFKVREALGNPIPPAVIENGNCQQVVITSEIDVLTTLPLIKHSEGDAGRILGGGVTLITGISGGKGTDLAFKRMFFRGKDFAALHIERGTNLAEVRDLEYKGQAVPLTINIGAPPAVCLVAAGGGTHVITPYGTDELGIAGAIQNSPVDICKAKTVDAYAIAESEWVLEGYLLTGEPLWETEEAEKIGKKRVAPFFPEWAGYMGKATLDRKFQVTAITHRENPIFYTPIAHTFETANMTHPLRDACIFELAERISPGLMIDVNAPWGMMGAGGVVLQVKKSAPEDDGIVKNFLTATAAACAMPVVVAVDEDIDIYSADDVLWAMWTRANHDAGIFKSPRDSAVRGQVPALEPARSRGGQSDGALLVDATVPFAFKGIHKRSHYPVDRIDLKKWFSEAEIAGVSSRQSEYARLLSKIGG